MSRETRQTAMLIVLLLGVGAFAWQMALRPALAVEADELGRLPRSVSSWKSQDVPIEQTVERILQADYNLQRAYVNPVGDLVWLYVGYYGTERGGRSQHTPWVCYPAAGWTVLPGRAQIVRAPDGRRAYEIVVARGGNQRLVHFWYRTHRSTGLVRSYEHALDRVVGRLVSGRGDGAFVRVSTPLESDDPLAARAKLIAFGSELDSQLADHWPREVPESA